jgi:hypothetical protein
MSGRRYEKISKGEQLLRKCEENKEKDIHEEKRREEKASRDRNHKEKIINP